MNKQTFVKKLIGIVHHEYHDKYARVHPYKHWKYIVLASMTVVIFLGAFSAYLYFEISNGRFFETKQNGEQFSPKTVDRKKLHETVLFYEEKRINFEQERVILPSFVDPSL